MVSVSVFPFTTVSLFFSKPPFLCACFNLVIAGCAVIATAMAQIFTNTYQKSLNCDALQLLYHTSPYIAVGMLIMCPMFDDLTALQKYQYSWGCILRISFSCVLALGVNISNYLVLGKTSPLTYQVLGHLKTVLILILGFTVFNKTADIRNISGIGIAMIGVIAYTEITRRQNSTGNHTNGNNNSNNNSQSILPMTINSKK